MSEYYRHSGTRDGLKRYCKPCGRVASGTYYREHAVGQNDKTRAKYWADPSKKAAYDREYRAKHRERIAAAKRADAANSRARWHRREHSDVERQRVKERSAQWYAANAEHARRRAAGYRRANRDKCAVWGEAYRAKRNAGAGVTASQWLSIRKALGGHCLACLASAHVTMDHVMPLSIGGLHDIWNVQPLCKSCNSRKNNTMIDYRPAGWEVLVADVAMGPRADQRMVQSSGANEPSASDASPVEGSDKHRNTHRPLPCFEGILLLK